jgi:hypothetical protein
MSRYRPEYVSIEEYGRRVQSNRARMALHEAAKATWLAPMDNPKLKFAKRDEAAFAGDLTEAQKIAAKLEPQLLYLYDVLKRGEVDREKEATPRWQAGFDLAMGRVMAVKVRTQAYNMMLAAAKRGLKFKEREEQHLGRSSPPTRSKSAARWRRKPPRLASTSNASCKDHEGTPWAYLAQKELERPLGWTWQEIKEAVPVPTSWRSDGASRGDVKILSRTLRELRYAFKVFARTATGGR